MAQQLTFTLDDNGHTNVVYSSTNPADNQLSLVIATTVDPGDTTLSPGTIVPLKEAADGDGSLFYLDLTNLNMTEAELNALTVDGSDWTAKAFYVPGTKPDSQIIAFTPTKAMAFTPAKPLTLSLNNFTLAAPPPEGPAKLTVIYFRVPPIAEGKVPRQGQLSVTVLPPPDQHALDLKPAIAVGISPDDVVNCFPDGVELVNNLTLTLAPGQKPAVITAGDKTVFTLSFVYAEDQDGFGAMMTREEAQLPFDVLRGEGAEGWGITPETDAQSPYWILTPPSGQSILGTDNAVSFQIEHLVTHFQAGPTLVSLAYKNIPGYQDGVYQILVLKQPHVRIENFTAHPEQSVLHGGEAPVTLSWQVSDATQLTLQPLNLDVTNKTSHQVSITETTQFTLIAEGLRPGNVDNIDTASCTAYVVPVIDFVARPAAVHQADFPYQTQLSWDVDTGGSVTLTSSVTGLDPHLYASHGSVAKPLSVPQMFTLTPQSAPNDVRNIIVSAFSQSDAVPQDDPDGIPAGVAAPSNAPFVAVTVPAANQVAILSTATFTTLQTVAVGANPQSLAFSPDGSALYVANADDGTVSVISVTNSNGPDGYAFATVNTVTVGAKPQQVAVGPDGAAWVTIDTGAGAGNLARISHGLNTPKVDTVTVGVNPRGVAVTPSGGLVFVANAGSNSVSVIANSLTGPLVRAPISNLNQPTDVAVSPDGETLLVACQGDRAVVKVDIAHYQTAPTTSQRLDATPRHLGLFRGGDYVVAGCDTTAILLNYVTGATHRVDLPGAAQGVGVTPEDGMALVSVAGQSGVSVITFNRYAQAGQPASCDGALTNAAVSSDGSLVLTWYDGLLSAPNIGPDSLDGVATYAANDDLTPGQTLSDLTLAHLAVSPGAKDDAFYLAPVRTPAITLYKTSTLAEIKSIPLPSKVGTSNRSAARLALSADGTKLFALVSDGANAYSIVVFSADIKTRTFTPIGDVSVFQCRFQPASWHLVAAPDGSGAWTIDPTAGKIYAIRQSGETYTLNPQSLSLPDGAQAYALAGLPDGSAVYAFATDSHFRNIVAVISLPAFSAATVYLPDPHTQMSLNAFTCSPDSKLLFGTDPVAAGVRILDAASLRIVQTLSWPAGVVGPTGIAISADGSRIFAASTGDEAGSLAVADQVQPQP
ncbi:YncE family protein [Tistrella mobilis]|uniref:YncE family protein n=1 Tax=Tistrella mobilis TaxID=171437 RepID=UPI0035570965